MSFSEFDREKMARPCHMPLTKDTMRHATVVLNMYFNADALSLHWLKEDIFTDFDKIRLPTEKNLFVLSLSFSPVKYSSPFIRCRQCDLVFYLWKYWFLGSTDSIKVASLRAAMTHWIDPFALTVIKGKSIKLKLSEGWPEGQKTFFNLSN